jgi:hypothetical protein
VSERRLLLWARLLVGIAFMYQGVARVQNMRATAEVFAANASWQAWPLVGGLRPLELTLWLALFEFFAGVFLFGGMLTRVVGPLGLLVAALQVGWLGLGGGLLNPALALGSLLVTLRGGGSGTMDSVLGKMQQRSIEREANRARVRAEGRAARHSVEPSHPSSNTP